MASNDNNRGKLLTAGGVLSIVAGIFQISSVVPIAVKSLVSSWPYGPSGLWEVAALWFLPFFPHEWCRKILWLFFPLNLTWGFILVGCVGVLGIVNEQIPGSAQVKKSAPTAVQDGIVAKEN